VYKRKNSLPLEAEQRFGFEGGSVFVRAVRLFGGRSLPPLGANLWVSRETARGEAPGGWGGRVATGWVREGGNPLRRSALRALPSGYFC
jgi:hypothetical protein